MGDNGKPQIGRIETTVFPPKGRFRNDPAQRIDLLPNRDHALRQRVLAFLAAHDRWIGSGAGDLEYEAMRAEVNALREELSR